MWIDHCYQVLKGFICALMDEDIIYWNVDQSLGLTWLLGIT